MIDNISTLKEHHFAVQSYFDQKLSSFNMDYHSHPLLELLYVVSGRVKYSVQNKSGTFQTEFLKSSDLILLDSNCKHKMSIDKESHILSLELRSVKSTADSPAYIDSYHTLYNCSSLVNAFDKNTYIKLNDYLQIKQSIMRLHALLSSNALEYVDHYFTQIIVSEILLSVNECYQKTYLTNPYNNLILEYIHRSYQENLSIESIAKAVNLNTSYLQKIFKKEMGNTVFDYITQFRINQSIALMRSTNLTLQDIAAEVGYNNRQSF